MNAKDFCERLKDSLQGLGDRGFALTECVEGDASHYLAVLRSEQLAIRFLFDRGAIEAAVGAPDAPATWSNESVGRRAWYSADMIALFMRQGLDVDLQGGIEKAKEIEGLHEDSWLSLVESALLQALQEVEEFFDKLGTDRLLAFEDFQSSFRAETSRQLDEYLQGSLKSSPASGCRPSPPPPFCRVPRPTEVKSALLEALDGVSRLLLSCGEKGKSEWFQDRRAALAAERQDSERFQQILREIQRNLGGMGSFSDLSLIPLPGSGLSKREARIQQWDHVERLDESIASLAEQGEG